jgi:hypothetical protein
MSPYFFAANKRREPETRNTGEITQQNQREKIFLQSACYSCGRIRLALDPHTTRRMLQISERERTKPRTAVRSSAPE